MNHFLGSVAQVQISAHERELAARLSEQRNSDSARAFAEYMGAVVERLKEQVIEAAENDRPMIIGGIASIRAALAVIYNDDFPRPKKQRQEPDPPSNY